MPASTPVSSSGCDVTPTIEQLRGQIDQLSRKVCRLDKKIDGLMQDMDAKRYCGTHARNLQALSKQVRNVVTAWKNGGGGLDAWLAAEGQEVSVTAYTPTDEEAPVCMLTRNGIVALTHMDVDLTEIKTLLSEEVSSVPAVALLERVEKARVLHGRPPLEMSPDQQSRLDALRCERVDAQNRLHRLQKQLLEQVMPPALRGQFRTSTRNQHMVTQL